MADTKMEIAEEIDVDYLAIKQKNLYSRNSAAGRILEEALHAARNGTFSRTDEYLASISLALLALRGVADLLPSSPQ